MNQATGKSAAAHPRPDPRPDPAADELDELPPLRPQPLFFWTISAVVVLWLLTLVILYFRTVARSS